MTQVLIVRSVNAGDVSEQSMIMMMTVKCGGERNLGRDISIDPEVASDAIQILLFEDHYSLDITSKPQSRLTSYSLIVTDICRFDSVKKSVSHIYEACPLQSPDERELHCQKSLAFSHDC